MISRANGATKVFLPIKEPSNLGFSQLKTALKAWPNARNILTQHLATLLHDVATGVERAGQTNATFSAFLTQHVDAHVPQAPGAQQVDLARMPLYNNVA